MNAPMFFSTLHFLWCLIFIGVSCLIAFVGLIIRVNFHIATEVCELFKLNLIDLLQMPLLSCPSLALLFSPLSATHGSTFPTVGNPLCAHPSSPMIMCSAKLCGSRTLRSIACPKQIVVGSLDSGTVEPPAHHGFSSYLHLLGHMKICNRLRSNVNKKNHTCSQPISKTTLRTLQAALRIIFHRLCNVLLLALFKRHVLRHFHHLSHQHDCFPFYGGWHLRSCNFLHPESTTQVR